MPATKTRQERRQARAARRNQPKQKNTTQPAPKKDESSSIQKDTRPRLIRDDICVGCIVWLPPRQTDSGAIKCVHGPSCCDTEELNNDGYDHPVIILKITGSANVDGECLVAMVTSQKPKRRDRFLRLEIAHIASLDTTESNDGVKLYLEKGAMDKQSYVVIHHTFSIPISALRSLSYKQGYRAFHTRLRKQSYLDLMIHFGLERIGDDFQETHILELRRAAILPRSTRTSTSRQASTPHPTPERATARSLYEAMLSSATHVQPISNNAALVGRERHDPWARTTPMQSSHLRTDQTRPLLHNQHTGASRSNYMAIPSEREAEQRRHAEMARLRALHDARYQHHVPVRDLERGSGGEGADSPSWSEIAFVLTISGLFFYGAGRLLLYGVNCVVSRLHSGGGSI